MPGSPKRLAIITSPAARDGHGSTLHQFLRQYGEYLWEYEIHATGGTHEAIARTGLLQADRLIRHVAGEQGGIVQVALLAIRKQFEAIALLLDPTDPFAESPENLALQRACISNGIPQLMNFGDLAHWIEYEAGRDDLDRYQHADRIDLKEDIVALVAHDGKKGQMLEFFAQYATFLTRKHKELIATGTTGRLVLELCLGTPYTELATKLDQERWNAIEQDLGIRTNWASWLQQSALWRKEWKLVNDLEPTEDQLKRVQFQHSTGRKAVLTLFKSGPDGGDIQIAARILDGICNAVLFFHDPQKPHPHDADIRLCIRTCQLPEIRVTLRRDIDSAKRWANGCQMGLRQGLLPATGTPPHWPQQVLVLPTQDRKPEGQNDDQVRQLTRTCAGYLDELLHELLSPGVRGRPRRRVLLLVAWGTTVRWTIDALADDKIVSRRGPYGDELLILPMIGLTGEGGNWFSEAPAITRDLSRVYCNEAHTPQLASPAFFAAGPAARGTPPGVAEIREKIERLLSDDESFVVALTTLRSWADSSRSAGMQRYPEICAPGATVELCGLFLDAQGQPVIPTWRTTPVKVETLLTFDHLHRIAGGGRKEREHRRGEVIVVCGYSEARTIHLATAIKSGLVNTLITDVQTRDACARLC